MRMGAALSGVVVMFGLLLAVVTTDVAALCLPTHNLNLPEIAPANYRYTRALIESLTYGKQAADRMRTATDDDAMPATVAELVVKAGMKLAEMRLANDDFRCAASIVKAYENVVVARDQLATELMRESASAAYLVFTTIADIYDEIIAVMIEARQSTVTEIAERKVRFTKAWELIGPVVATASHGLVKLHETDPSKNRLALTRKERGALLDELKRHFGPVVNRGIQDDSHPTEAGALLLYRFLSNRQWKAADE
jgi:hypothetical protein